jgi:uncharacterized protein YukJ
MGRTYGVWSGQIVKTMIGSHNHYEIWVKNKIDGDYRIAVNCMSDDNSEVQYVLVRNFNHPYIDFLKSLSSSGFHPLKKNNSSGALDYIRTNPPLFDISEFENSEKVPTRSETIDENNDIVNTLQEHLFELTKKDTIVYSVGDSFEDRNKSDDYFDFSPEKGIHDIHYKQYNDHNHAHEDGQWQDGSIFFKIGDEWVALFIKFQSQRIYKKNEIED